MTEIPAVTYRCPGTGDPDAFPCDKEVTILVTEDRPDDWTCYNGVMYCAAHTPEQAR